MMIPKILFEDDGNLSIEDIRMGMAKVGRKENGKVHYAILNKDGDFVSGYEYEIVREFSEGYAVVANNYWTSSRDGSGDVLKSKFGLISSKGTQTIPLIYDSLGTCHDGLINAKRDGKWGYVDTNGTVVIPFIYEEARCFSEGLAAVKLGERYGFVNTKGKVVIGFNFIWTHDFSDGVCFVQTESVSEKTGISYVDKKGKVTVKVNSKFGRYGMPSDYSQGIMILDKNIAVNKKGSVDFELEERYQMQSFKNGIACVYDAKTEKYGFVDSKGKFVVPCQYENCCVQENDKGNLIGVQADNNKWGIIDTNGNEVIPTQYNKLHGFSEGRVLVTADNNRVCSIEVM